MVAKRHHLPDSPPWSFLDTDGDGKGDLNGIVERLDYIVSLGGSMPSWLTPHQRVTHG